MNQEKKLLKQQIGYTLIELSFVLMMMIGLSFALFKGIRLGIQSMNMYTAQQQAKNLVQLLHIDFELASAVRDVHNLHDFIGYLYTRDWPASLNTIFNTSQQNVIDLRQLTLNQRGCISAALQLKPCWSSTHGLWIELDYHVDHDDIEPMVIRFTSLNTQAKTLLGLGADAIMVQNHYFQQTSVYSTVRLDDIEEPINVQ